uniref:RRM domain-containing protein n=1 Tax=Sinocyclocheilus anshuiensis TaxID=1608454 RepID=A0A671KW70_9TELE
LDDKLDLTEASICGYISLSFEWSSSEDNIQQIDLSWPLLVMLHDVFDPFGPICSLQVFRSRNNFCRGYALVTFEHRSDAKNALEALDFSELLDKRPMHPSRRLGCSRSKPS